MESRNGSYKTERGSTALVYGKHSGAWKIEFDWFEEGACIEAHPSVDFDGDEAWLHWNCECCDSGQARLYRAEAAAIKDGGGNA